MFASSGVEVLPYQVESGSVWHAKRHAIAAGLHRAWTAYFVDGDHFFLENQPVPKLQRLAVGASAFARIQGFDQLAFKSTGQLEQIEQAACLKAVAEHLGVANLRDLTWWGDWLFAVTRDTADDSGAWVNFLPTWDRFARWSATRPNSPKMILGDGVAMACAAHACGWTPEIRNEAFAPIVRAFRHMACGEWRQRYRKRASRPVAL